MALSTAERQTAWRNRLSIRSAFFEVMDEKRRHALDLAFMLTTGKPQDIRTVRDFFLAYPLCFVAPRSIVDTGGCLLVTFDQPVEVEPAAALIALGGPALVQGHDPAPADLGRVQTDVEKLRNLGLWRK